MIKKILGSLGAVAILSYSSVVFSWGEDEYCHISDIEADNCEKGEVLMLYNPMSAVNYCDMEKQIAVIPLKTFSVVLCTYTGEKRVEKKSD